MTNFDAIKTMTAEQFSEWLCNTVDNCFQCGVVLNYKPVLASLTADYGGWIEKYEFKQGASNEGDTLYSQFPKAYADWLKEEGFVSAKEFFK